MDNEDYESVEETLRIMADVMNKEAVQFNIAPEFLQEVADEIADLKRQLAEKS
jgi:ABC-type Fe3+-hydroxamate transport system substrate-binding protein